MRVRKYNSKLNAPVGAYSANSKGYDYVREKIAKFIEQRDGLEEGSADPN